jgi:hypothetical protein
MEYRTCINVFADNKCNEFSQQSRTSGYKRNSPECVVSEDESSASDEFTLVELLSSTGSSG